MTATSHISRILVFVSLILALWLGASAISTAAASPGAGMAPIQIADDHGGCC
jgi:hypothetical protein